MITWISILSLSAVSACTGRAGGQSHDPTSLPKWMPMWLRQSWVRDWLCPMCAYILVFPGFNLELVWWLLAYGATGGFLSLYWDKLFGYDNFYFSGFMVGLAGLFLIGIGLPVEMLIARAFLLAGGWGLLNLYCNKHTVKDGVEEMIRYGFFTLTMALPMWL